MFVTAGGSPSDTTGGTSTPSQRTTRSRQASRSASHSSRQPSPVHPSQKSPSRPGSQRHSHMYRSSSGCNQTSQAQRIPSQRSPALKRSSGAPGVELTSVEPHAAPAPQIPTTTSFDMEGQGQPARVVPAKGAAKHSHRATYDTHSQHTDALSNSSALSSQASKVGERSRELGAARRSRADNVRSLFAPAAQGIRAPNWRGARKVSSYARTRKESMEHDRSTAAMGLDGPASDAGIHQAPPPRSGSMSPGLTTQGRLDARVDTRWAGRSTGRGGRVLGRGACAGAARGKGRGNNAGRSSGRSDASSLPRGVGMGRPLL